MLSFALCHHGISNGNILQYEMSVFLDEDLEKRRVKRGGRSVFLFLDGGGNGCLWLAGEAGMKSRKGKATMNCSASKRAECARVSM